MVTGVFLQILHMGTHADAAPLVGIAKAQQGLIVLEHPGAIGASHFSCLRPEQISGGPKSPAGDSLDGPAQGRTEVVS